MTFMESVRTCFGKYADFGGCASRSEFWWWVLFTIIVGASLQILGARLNGIFGLATFIPNMAVTARRLHDTDRSGWLQLLWLVPVIGWILLIIWCAQEGVPNRFGGSQSQGAKRV